MDYGISTIDIVNTISLYIVTQFKCSLIGVELIVTTRKNKTFLEHKQNN